MLSLSHDLIPQFSDEILEQWFLYWAVLITCAPGQGQAALSR